ncbi:MAG TPA: hypothetical protein DDZ81_25845 [Acetobacteraceae bacterium]|jgi:exopolysaccharide biosynthesis polyprenyl glycosylphosphotransferase|nr:hypothetical protein [Acetobacteraceae bacterium]
MQPAIARYLPRDMAILGLIEAALSFAAIYAVITMADTSGTLPIIADMPLHDAFGLAAVMTLTAAATGAVIGLYRFDVCLDRKRLLAKAGLAAMAAIAIALPLRNKPLSAISAAEALFLAKMLTAWLATITLIRLIYRCAAGARHLRRRILLIGEPDPVRLFKGYLQSRRGRAFVPVTLQPPGIGWKLAREQGIWGIVAVGGEPPAPTMAALLDCKLRGLKILTSAAFHEEFLGRIDLDALTANDLLIGQGFGTTRSGAVAKRATDVILAITMLILALPLMAITALAIKADSPGPVLCRQRRIGQFGRPFTLFTFRTMTADAEADGHPRSAHKRDSRVTRVGRFIRANHIDELPQLANVITGEMSLVGPRPERPHFVEHLTRTMPFYRLRAYVKPGLTGWAQVNVPHGASVEDAREKLAYDLYYVKHRSIMTDAAILLSTIRVMLFREEAR